MKINKIWKLTFLSSPFLLEMTTLFFPYYWVDCFFPIRLESVTNKLIILLWPLEISLLPFWSLVNFLCLKERVHLLCWLIMEGVNYASCPLVYVYKMGNINNNHAFSSSSSFNRKTSIHHHTVFNSPFLQAQTCTQIST